MVLHFLPLVLAMSGQAPPPQQAPPPPPQQSVPATPTAPARPPQAPRKIYNETADAKALIANAVAGAEESDIRVLINWGANDDERCTKFTQVQRSPEITTPRFFSDEYKVAYVDVGHLDKNMDVAATYDREAGGRRTALFHDPRHPRQGPGERVGDGDGGRRPGDGRSEEVRRVSREAPGAGAGRRPALPGRPEPGEEGRQVRLPLVLGPVVNVVP